MKAALRRQLVFVHFVFLVVVNLLDNSVRQSLTYGPIAAMQKAPAAQGNRGLNPKVNVDVAGSESVQQRECLHDGCLDGEAVVVDFAGVRADQAIGTLAPVELVDRTAAVQ
jgi:hypothetical protein